MKIHIPNHKFDDLPRHIDTVPYPGFGVWMYRPLKPETIQPVREGLNYLLEFGKTLAKVAELYAPQKKINFVSNLVEFRHYRKTITLDMRRIAFDPCGTSKMSLIHQIHHQLSRQTRLNPRPNKYEPVLEKLADLIAFGHFYL